MREEEATLPEGPVEKKRISWGSLFKKPWFITLVTVLIVLAAVGLSINRIMLTLLHSRAEVIVPPLEGKSVMDALGTLSSLNLSLRQDGTEFDESLPAGTIIRQHPPAGMKVREGRAMRVVISKGGQVVFIPDIAGKLLAEAQSILATNGIQIGAVTEVYSADGPKGVVLSQNPSSTTIVTRGALVDVHVSKGPPPAGLPIVPDFRGQSVDQVKDWAAGFQASVQLREDPSAIGPAGTVVRQEPGAGQPLLEDEDVRIVIVPFVAPGQGARFTYLIPGDQKDLSVRIVARDNRGESQIYQGKHDGGQTIEIPLGITSTTRIRVYVNEELKEERVMEP